MSWSSWLHINSRMIGQMRVGRVFLGGDSAHIHSPAGAQGMNTGMQDMVNLAWKLAKVSKGEARPEILDTYTADRTAVIQNVLTKTEGLTKLIGSENAVVRELFEHLGPWLVETEFVQKNSTERMSQLANNYRDSPLSVSAGHSGGLRAGDRLPDLAITVLNRQGSAEIQTGAGTTFGLLDPGGWTFLRNTHLIGSSEADPDAFVRFFGTTSLVLLVRPDGYIAFTGDEHSMPSLQKYCEKWLISDAPKLEVSA